MKKLIRLFLTIVIGPLIGGILGHLFFVLLQAMNPFGEVCAKYMGDSLIKGISCYIGAVILYAWLCPFLIGLFIFMSIIYSTKFGTNFELTKDDTGSPFWGFVHIISVFIFYFSFLAVPFKIIFRENENISIDLILKIITLAFFQTEYTTNFNVIFSLLLSIAILGILLFFGIASIIGFSQEKRKKNLKKSALKK